MKARFVVQEHEDSMKHSLVHSTSVSSQQATKILVEIAVVLGLRLFSTDVTETYLESMEKLMGDVFIKAPKELNLDPNPLLNF